MTDAENDLLLELFQKAVMAQMEILDDSETRWDEAFDVVVNHMYQFLPLEQKVLDIR